MPGGTRSVTCAARMTEPRSLKARTRSPSSMPRAAASLRVEAHDPVVVAVVLSTRWSLTSFIQLSLASPMVWKLKRGWGETICSGYLP